MNGSAWGTSRRRGATTRWSRRRSSTSTVWTTRLDKHRNVTQMQFSVGWSSIEDSPFAAVFNCPTPVSTCGVPIRCPSCSKYPSASFSSTYEYTSQVQRPGIALSLVYCPGLSTAVQDKERPSDGRDGVRKGEMVRACCACWSIWKICQNPLYITWWSKCARSLNVPHVFRGTYNFAFIHTGVSTVTASRRARTLGGATD